MINDKFSKENHNKVQIILRTGIIIIMMAVAVGVPNLDPFISLVGAVFFSVLGILVPAVIETVYIYPDLGRFNWMMIKNVVLSVTGPHLESLNNRGRLTIPEDQNEITEDDLAEVKEIARECDAVLVIGAPNSSNSVRLVEVAEREGIPAALIQRAESAPTYLDSRRNSPVAPYGWYRKRPAHPLQESWWRWQPQSCDSDQTDRRPCA